MECLTHALKFKTVGKDSSQEEIAVRKKKVIRLPLRTTIQCTNSHQKVQTSMQTSLCAFSNLSPNKQEQTISAQAEFRVT